EAELADTAVRRLGKLQLVERDGDALVPLPALARFSLGEAEVVRPREGERAAVQLFDGEVLGRPCWARRFWPWSVAMGGHRTGRPRRRGSCRAGSRCGWAWSSSPTTPARSSGSATATFCSGATTARASPRCCR